MDSPADNNLTRRQALGLIGALALPWENVLAQTANGTAPAATPPAAIARLSAEIMTILRKPEIIAPLEKLGFTIEPRFPDQFRPYQQQEIETWITIARDAGIKPVE